MSNPITPSSAEPVMTATDPIPVPVNRIPTPTATPPDILRCAYMEIVVTDLAASRKFYGALLDVLGAPIGGEGPTFFWADELFVSSADSPAALGKLTGRHHLAFQARDRAAVEAFHKAGQIGRAHV